jgi:DNA polymerase III delta prime subunit
MTTAAELILDTARRGELHHAIILYGPAPDRLREVATRIAQTLNCLNGTTGDDCTSCVRIARRMHPDVHYVEVAGDRKLISVEQIRDLVGGAALRPYEGRNKVFIIDPADAVSPGGSNSLLKTLEEPTRDTTFLLLTRTPDLLLPTIKSRSQPIFVGGEERRDEALAQSIRTLLARFAENGDSTALLTLAALVSSQEEVKDSIALLGTILCDEVVAGALRDRVGPERILAAADATTAAVRWMGVNADPRMLVEQAVARLVA